MQDAPLPAVLISGPLHVGTCAANNWDEAHWKPIACPLSNDAIASRRDAY